ncbi:MAG: hypothetical protein KF729_34815 [Sandaracinaceae bacterium]|nr:hypothetical protein [Sandaracinaceae bacterium]
MSAGFVSSRAEELVPAGAHALAALAIALYAALYAPPSLAPNGARAFAPELVGHFAPSLLGGIATTLAIVAGVLAALGWRRVPVGKDARVFSALELPPSLGVFVSGLLLAFGIVLALAPVIDYSTYGVQADRLFESALGVFCVAAGWLLGGLRRLTVVDRAAGTLTITWGKPFAWRRRRYALADVSGVFLHVVHRAPSTDVYRVMVALPGGAGATPLEVHFTQATAERALRRIASWAGLPLVGPPDPP